MPKAPVKKKPAAKASVQTDFMPALTQLFDRYRGRPHPLEYRNRFQLVIMTLLSAQDSDRHINQIAPEFFKSYPDLASLVDAKFEDLMPLLSSVRNFGNKIKWILSIAKSLQKDENIPTTLTELTQLNGIGRKSANVIIRESGGEAEGIIVDLHVVRVAPRIGLVDATSPDKIEKQLMAQIPQKYWNDAGMAISFLGREICRPSNPKCEICVMNEVCEYFKSVVRG